MKSDRVLWEKGPFVLHRRSLEINEKSNPNKSQLQSAAREVLAFRDAGSWAIGDLCAYAEAIGRPEPIDEVAEEVVRDRQMVRKCFYVSKAIAPEDRGFDLYWSFYYLVYTFPAEVRNRLLKMAEDEHWKLDQFKSHLKSLRSSVRRELQKFPPGEFGLILADPPWRYDNGSTDPSRAIENQYQTMELEEIQALTDPGGRTVSQIAGDACILYLWATSPKLQEALTVMEAWGFEYKSSMVWVKDLQGMGYWNRSRHEILLIGVRGDVIPPSEDQRPDSVMQYPRGEHSVKPIQVIEMLEAMYGHLPKIELFARGEDRREGWSVWGDQAPEDKAIIHDDPTMADADNDGTGDVEAGAEQAARDAEAKPRKAKKAAPKKKAAAKTDEAKADSMKPRLVKGKKDKPGADAVH